MITDQRAEVLDAVSRVIEGRARQAWRAECQYSSANLPYGKIAMFSPCLDGVEVIEYDYIIGLMTSRLYQFESGIYASFRLDWDSTIRTFRWRQP